MYWENRNTSAFSDGSIPVPDILQYHSYTGLHSIKLQLPQYVYSFYTCSILYIMHQWYIIQVSRPKICFLT